MNVFRMEHQENKMSRKEKRLQYWESKYGNPLWSGDIHYGVFDDLQKIPENFDAAVRNNTLHLAEHLEKTIPSFLIGRSACVVDFACGGADLLLELSNRDPRPKYVGIDISTTAIEHARTKIQNRKIDLELKNGGIEILSTHPSGSIVALICREAYYLLCSIEKQQFWDAAKEGVAMGGIVVIQEPVAHGPLIDTVEDFLTSRHFGGAAVEIDDPESPQCCSLVDDAGQRGFQLEHCEILEKGCISASYRVAAEMVDAANGGVPSNGTLPAYESLASAENGAGIPYIRYTFRARPEAKEPSFGFSLLEPFSYAKSDVILKASDFWFKKGKWTLLLGDSGAGKTTILRFIGDELKGRMRECHRHPGRCFVLSQHTELVEELSVEDNLRLFSTDGKLVEDIVQLLGLDGKLRKRRASRSCLSGGQLRRVALGQAVAAKPDLLILDEPCAGVDQTRRFRFFHTLRNLLPYSPETLICVDHDFAVIKEFFDAVAEIVDGKLVHFEIGEDG